MADSKITALASIGTGTDPANDPLVIVDVSDVSPGGMSATGTTKKVTLNNLLACSPTATLASATITGDLTVDTSTLKVDSANNRVGINTASPVAGSTLHIVDSDPTILLQGNQLSGTRYNRIKFANQPGSINYEIYGGYYGTGGLYVADYTNNGILFGVSNTPGTFTERYKIDSTGVATWSNVGGVAGTAMTLNSTGLGVGVTPAGTGGCLQLKSGITFPATQVASSDANTLDDYEEGTFTPTIIGNTIAGVGVYVNQVGTYSKVGNQVTVWVNIEWSSHTGTGTQMYVGGLPFSVRVLPGYNAYATLGYINNIALTAGNFPLLLASNSDSFARFFQSPTGGGTATAVPMDTAGHVGFSMTYTV